MLLKLYRKLIFQIKLPSLPKNELERLFKLVIKTPEIKIDYDYFALISDYIDWIENNKFLKKTL
ncbi:MAG: hypothetical protein U9Q85_02275 [Patescibacteria group bacterium]|nr:hypothetical protein [Patescibacteria group bacterium]